ncbi:hypothetical protein BaRGS_00004290 [Batillaria attramentaria]|uniref:Uncharacterized protein n=1 Tax=Batillaria attramentaria TaxID=370345 RepID=A0ABD0LXM3_9CAEN
MEVGAEIKTVSSTSGMHPQETGLPKPEQRRSPYAQPRPPCIMGLWKVYGHKSRLGRLRSVSVCCATTSTLESHGLYTLLVMCSKTGREETEH